MSINKLCLEPDCMQTAEDRNLTDGSSARTKQVLNLALADCYSGKCSTGLELHALASRFMGHDAEPAVRMQNTSCVCGSV